MKIENTPEEKAKFLSLNVGHKVTYERILGDKPEVITGTLIGICLGDSIDTCIVKHDNGLTDEVDVYESGIWLELRPLSNITDDEAIEVAKIIYGDRANEVQFLLVKDGIVNMFDNGWNIHGTKMLALFDCLRGFGIALPVFYKGVQYSVEKLIELGIYNLKSN